MVNIPELEACWNQRMADFDKCLEAAITLFNPTLQHLTEEFKSFRDIVRSMLNSLHQQTRDVAIVVDALDMRQRQKILLFNGIPEDGVKDVEPEVLNIIQMKLGMSQVSSDSIKRCHRIGVFNGDHIRPVLVHFKHHHTKVEVWRSKGKLKGSGYTVSEFLTKVWQAIHKKCRKHFGMKNVWTFDGVIHIKLPDGGHKKVISEEQLEGLITEYPDTTICSSETLTTSRQLQEVRSKPSVTVIHSEDHKRSRRVISKK